MWRLVSHTEPTLYPFCTPRIKIPNKPYIIPRGSITEAKKSLVPHSFFSLSHHPNTFFIPFSFSLNSATTISNNIAMPSMKTSSSKTSESSRWSQQPRVKRQVILSRRGTCALINHEHTRVDKYNVFIPIDSNRK